MAKTAEENQNPPSLEKLRSELADSQRKYLNLFWGNYLEFQQWPKTIDFHRDHDQKEVRETLRASPLNGGIVMEQTGSGDEHFELTLIGILLTENGKHYEELRIRLLEFLSKKYYQSQKENRKTKYSDEEVVAELKLSEPETRMLGEVGAFDSTYRIYHTSPDRTHWVIEFPRKEIQSIPRNGSFADYHERIVFQQYYPQHKVFIDDRHAAQPAIAIPKGLFSSDFGTDDDFDSSSSHQDDAPLLMRVPDVEFVKDEKLRQFAGAAAQEASRCFSMEAFSATVVMTVAATEAVLLDLLLQNKEKDLRLKDAPLDTWRLEELIKTVLNLNLLGEATTSLAQIIRQHRNLIHPGKSLRERKIISQGDAYIIWGFFVKVCDELG